MDAANRSQALIGLVVIMAGAWPRPAAGAQEASTGLRIRALPVVNFDADEGFGYGAAGALHQYGSGERLPYEWALNPTVFFTTEGRRDLTAFFDAPHLLPRGWRLSVFLGNQRQSATPYYGLGNESAYDETLDADDGPNPKYYRFGRDRWSGNVTLQGRLTSERLRFLVGAGVVRTSLDPTPKDEGTTLYAMELGLDQTVSWANYLRAGVVWDTRDRETGPRKGVWSEILVQRVDEAFGADHGYTRWTVADRRYFSLGTDVVFAHRYLIQGTGDDAPLHELFLVESSFRQQEGLGGGKTVRGLLKNRYVGRGMLVWNAELRWRAREFRLLRRDFHLVLSAFLDQGRVWEDSVQLDQLFSDLHRGFGGGVRLGLGDSFVVGLDLGTTDEAGVQFYTSVGYLF